MKLIHCLTAAVVAVPVWLIFAQGGSLTPPGPPAPSMKSLQQIEPRFLIQFAPVTIAAPGSYYLTTNLTVASGTAILIESSNVTLDLNGFTISSTASPAEGAGIFLNGPYRNIVVRNGCISGEVTYDSGTGFTGPGFQDGIDMLTAVGRNIRVTDLSVSGCMGDGIKLRSDTSTLVERCNIDATGSQGIVAETVRGCTAHQCGGTGISAETVADSSGESVAYSSGIAARSIFNCVGQSAGGAGIVGDAATNCYGQGIGTATGVNADVVTGCRGVSEAGIGITGYTVSGSFGQSNTGQAITAVSVHNSRATNAIALVPALLASTVDGCQAQCGGDGDAIQADVAANSKGVSVGGDGVDAAMSANCQGESTTSIGVKSTNAINCSGQSGDYFGLTATYSAFNCFGRTLSGTVPGLSSGVANTCFGWYGDASGTAIDATIAIGCIGFGPISATDSYLMPP